MPFDAIALPGQQNQRENQEKKTCAVSGRFERQEIKNEIPDEMDVNHQKQVAVFDVNPARTDAEQRQTDIIKQVDCAVLVRRKEMRSDKNQRRTEDRQPQPPQNGMAAEQDEKHPEDEIPKKHLFINGRQEQVYIIRAAGNEQ